MTDNYACAAERINNLKAELNATKIELENAYGTCSRLQMHLAEEREEVERLRRVLSHRTGYVPVPVVFPPI